MLDEQAKGSLLEEAEFLPTEFEGELRMEPDDLWNYWNFIIAGKATVFTKLKTVSSIEFKVGDCIGPLRLVVSENPYQGVEWTKDIQIVRIPYSLIHGYLSSFRKFDNEATLRGRAERWSLGIV